MGWSHERQCAADPKASGIVRAKVSAVGGWACADWSPCHTAVGTIAQCDPRATYAGELGHPGLELRDLLAHLTDLQSAQHVSQGRPREREQRRTLGSSDADCRSKAVEAASRDCGRVDLWTPATGGKVAVVELWSRDLGLADGSVSLDLPAVPLGSAAACVHSSSRPSASCSTGSTSFDGRGTMCGRLPPAEVSAGRSVSTQ
jgi:hypothetical protein